jgi:MFS transporter, SP family, sugar:H+ symporter
MMVFCCLFIIGFATTWGPMVWALIGELYPSQYRAPCMAMATATNWILNFAITICSPMIMSVIGYRYGFVFAAFLLVCIAVVYFFVCESNGRTLEEIDTMYASGVKPWKSSKWQPAENVA